MNINYRTYLINLRKDHKRLSSMNGQLKKLKMNFEVQSAVDGNTFDFSHIVNNDAHKLTNGEKGCALSHKHILQKFIKTNDDYAVILEDDIRLPEHFKKIIEEEMSNNKKLFRWDYLTFNYPSVGFKFIHLWLFLLKRRIYDSKSYLIYLMIPVFLIKFIFIFTISMLELVREMLYKKIYTYGKVSIFYRPVYLTGCYIITKRGAKKILNVQKNLKYSADRAPNIARIKNNLHFRAFVPLVVFQERYKFKSNLTKGVKYYFDN